MALGLYIFGFFLLFRNQHKGQGGSCKLGIRVSGVICFQYVQRNFCRMVKVVFFVCDLTFIFVYNIRAMNLFLLF